MCNSCRTKIENDLNNLKNQNDGRTIHEVQNMRHVGEFLLKMLDDPRHRTKETDEKICYEAGRLRERVISYYRRKYYPKHL